MKSNKIKQINTKKLYTVIQIIVLLLIGFFITYRHYHVSKVTLNACNVTLKYGDVNNDVKVLQEQLNLHKKDIGGTLNVDGDYGYLTEAAVKNYQSEHKILVTGKVDWSTWKVLLNRNTCTLEL